MIDENAFGVLVAHYDLESIEYSLETQAFLEYLGRFTERVEKHLLELPLGVGIRRIDLGHAIYLEFADGDQQTDPIAWSRKLRQAFVDSDVPNVCVLTAGGRWIVSRRADEMDSDGSLANELQPSDPPPISRESGAFRVSSLPEPENSNPQVSPSPLAVECLETERQPQYGPSEPLRKALAAEAFAQPTTSCDGDSSWGPGLYIEKEAIEQLGKNLKNAPTALAVHSATFYRIGG